MPQDEQLLPPDFFLGLDRSGPVPLYYQVSNLLEEAIHDETLPAGARLENEVALSARLGLSRPTIRRAIQELVDKGLLVRRRGIGTQVVHGRVTRNVELTSLYEDLERTGQKPETLLLSSSVEGADEKTAEALGVEVGSPTLHLARMRSADGVPLAILDNVLPEPFVDLDMDSLEKHGLYQLLRGRGVTMRVAKQRIGARVGHRLRGSPARPAQERGRPDDGAHRLRQQRARRRARPALLPARPLLVRDHARRALTQRRSCGGAARWLPSTSPGVRRPSATGPVPASQGRHPRKSRRGVQSSGSRGGGPRLAGTTHGLGARSRAGRP